MADPETKEEKVVEEDPTAALSPRVGSMGTPMPPAAVEQEKEAADEEKKIQALADMPGWKIVDKFLQENIENLENVQALMADSTDETGRKTVGADEFLINAKANAKAAGILRTVRTQVNKDAQVEQ